MPEAPSAASSQPITNEVEFSLDRPRKRVQVKIEPSDSPPLTRTLLAPMTNPSDIVDLTTDLDLQRPHAPPAASMLTPEVIDLTDSLPPVQFSLDRPLHKARSSGFASTTLPPAVSLDRPLRKAKSAQSYPGPAPSADNPSFGPGRGTHPGFKQELTREDWADDKLSFPRNKVGDALHCIFGD